MNWLIGAIVALILAVGIQTYRLQDAQASHAEYVAGIEKAATAASEAARATEQRHQTQINQVQNNALAQKALDDANAAALVAAGDGLQSQLSSVLADRAALRARLATRGKTIDDLADLLAQLRAEADRYAGELAADLDASRRAGFACEAAYDAITHP